MAKYQKITKKGDYQAYKTEDGKKKTYSGTQLARRLGKMAPHDESSFGLQAKVWVDSMRNAMQKVGYTYDPQNPNNSFKKSDINQLLTQRRHGH